MDDCPVFDSVAQLPSWVKEFAANFPPPGLLLISGSLGAGKTTFIDYWVRAMGGGGATSATFSYHQHCLLPNSEGLDHFDLYRLQNSADADSVGLWEAVAASQTYVVIEWPERLSPAQIQWLTKIWLAKNHGRVIKLTFSYTDSGARRVAVDRVFHSENL